MIRNVVAILFQRLGCLARGHEWRKHGDWEACGDCPALRKAQQHWRVKYVRGRLA